MDYFHKIHSLQELSSAAVAVLLCQDGGFKEVALLLEKPTYGVLYDGHIFVSDLEKLSEWDRKKNNISSNLIYDMSCYLGDEGRVERWDAAIEERSRELMEFVPTWLRHGLRAQIVRVALECLSYGRRMEILFGVSRYFLADFLSCGDWTGGGRLDERGLAERLVRDDRLTVLQRYRIACAYCLEGHASRLRATQLTEEEKVMTGGRDERGHYLDTHILVSLWSLHLDGKVDWPVWFYAAHDATRYGNGAAVKVCWENMGEDRTPKRVSDFAKLSLKGAQKLHAHGSDNKKRLVSIQLPVDLRRDRIVEDLNLPSHHSDLMCFFLSQMDEEEQRTFFKMAFESPPTEFQSHHSGGIAGFLSDHTDGVMDFNSRRTDGIMECFLDWPHQDYFMPTIGRFWGVMPRDQYGQCLLSLAIKYMEKYSKDYDYGSLLVALWEETPQEYKQYVFSDRKPRSAAYAGYAVLKGLLERLQEQDEALFKMIFLFLPNEERRRFIRPDSRVGRNISRMLMQREKWRFVDWLLQACCSDREVPGAKKDFLLSEAGVSLCTNELRRNRERFVDDLTDWGFVSDADKKHFKRVLKEELSKPYIKICW